MSPFLERVSSFVGEHQYLVKGLGNFIDYVLFHSMFRPGDTSKEFGNVDLCYWVD